MAGHRQLYAQCGSSGSNKELFRHTLQGMKEFGSASERLRLLCSHALSLLEEEPQNLLERSVSGEEDKNAAFR